MTVQDGKTPLTHYKDLQKEINELTNQDKQSLKDIIKEKDYHALSKHLEEGIGDYLQSDTFRRYLDFVSKFHHYSPKNIKLILEQQPKATRVAGFQTLKMT